MPKIIYEDNHLVVLSKPAGWLSQAASKNDDNLVDWLRSLWNRNYVGLIHRLDRNTSGVMLVAKRSKAAARLSQALKDGEIVRTYLGWLNGSLKSTVHWQHRLLKDTEKNLVKVSEGGKDARLTVVPKRHSFYKDHPITLAEFTLETGRSHQIRVQAAHEGYPVLGDRKYAKSGSAFPRIALHSHYLRFHHPMSQEALQFKVPLPKELQL